jgi:ABC-2 type transport system ATP-binding protein
MQEVEAICDRVIIIDHGKIVTDKKLDKLVSEEKEQIIEVEFDKAIEADLLANLDLIKTYKNSGENLWLLTFNTEEDMRPKVFDFAHDNGLKTLQISLKSKNLEQIFREKTKKK